MTAGGWRIMAQYQRQIALRVTSAYRTVSGDVLLVLAGIAPMDLMATECADLYEGRQNNWDQTDVRKEARQKLEEAWQIRWSSSEKGELIRRLIPEIVPWLGRKHGNITYQLVQAFSGHRCFAG